MSCMFKKQRYVHELCTWVNTLLEEAHIRLLCRVSWKNSKKRCTVMILPNSINPLTQSVPEDIARILTYHVDLYVHQCAVICWRAQRWYVAILSASVCTQRKACTYSTYSQNKILKGTVPSRTLGITLHSVCGNHCLSLILQPRVVFAWSYIHRLVMFYASMNAKVSDKAVNILFHPHSVYWILHFLVRIPDFIVCGKSPIFCSVSSRRNGL
jgi:hypothetical protein